MTTIGLTLHAKDRLNNRLRSIISVNEVATAVTTVDFALGETWVKVKSLPKSIVLGKAHGDTVYIVVKKRKYDCNVVTILLRESHQRINGDFLVDRSE